MERIEVQGISKEFNIGYKKRESTLSRIRSWISGKEPKKRFKALDNVSMNCKKGEILGLIGKNGSGKSTLLRIIAGIYEKDKGKIITKGKIIPLIGLGSVSIGRLSIRENIFLLSSFFGMGQNDIKKSFKSIVAFAELEEFVETKLYQLSSGMLQRLFFSISIHAKPDILLLDEVFAVGDEGFRKKSAKKIKLLVKEGVSVILVSHELWMIEKYCDRVLWLDKGKVKKEGKTKEMLKEYKE